MKTKIRNRLLILIVSIAFLSATFSSAQENKLVVFSPHWEGIQKEFDTAFKQWCRANLNIDVTLEWPDIGGGTSTMVKYIRDMFQNSPEGIGMDIFFGGGTDPYLTLTEEGLLQPYKLPDEQLKKIPEMLFGNRLYDAEYHWYGAAISGFGIIYNKVLRERLKLPEIEGWQDLTEPKLIGRVGAADPRQSGSAHAMYELILQGYGWEKGFQIITEMSGNIKRFPPAASQVPKDVSTGDVVYGHAIDFYAYQTIAQTGADNIGYVIPEYGFTPDSIGILKGAPNLTLAQKFVSFVLSEPGQKLWMLRKGEPDGPTEFDLNRASVLPHLYDELGDRSVVPVNPFKIKSSFQYEFQKASDRRVIVDDLIGALVIDQHQKLVAAWKAIAQSKNKKAALQEFNKIPITEQEALELARGKWKTDSAFRNQKVSEWSNFAAKKYDRAKVLAGEEKGCGLLGIEPLVILLPFLILGRRKREARRAGKSESIPDDIAK